MVLRLHLACLLRLVFASCSGRRRTGAHTAYPDYWLVMRPQLDCALKFVWEELSNSGVRVATFWKSNQDVLSLFADKGDLAALVEAGADVEHIADKVRKVVESGGVCMSMFADSWLRVSRHVFITDIEQRLRDIEHHNFDSEEVAAFQSVMQSQARQLVSIGHKQFEKRETKVTFLGRQVKINVEAPNDEWELRFVAMAKSVVLNGGSSTCYHGSPCLWSLARLRTRPAR